MMQLQENNSKIFTKYRDVTKEPIEVNLIEYEVEF